MNGGLGLPVSMLRSCTHLRPIAVLPWHRVTALLRYCTIWRQLPAAIFIISGPANPGGGLALMLALVYFFLLTTLPEWLESVPRARPDLLVWTPNVIFQGMGLVLFRFVERN